DQILRRLTRGHRRADLARAAKERNRKGGPEWRCEPYIPRAQARRGSWYMPSAPNEAGQQLATIDKGMGYCYSRTLVACPQRTRLSKRMRGGPCQSAC